MQPNFTATQRLVSYCASSALVPFCVHLFYSTTKRTAIGRVLLIPVDSNCDFSDASTENSMKLTSVLHLVGCGMCLGLYLIYMQILLRKHKIKVVRLVGLTGSTEMVLFPGVVLLCYWAAKKCRLQSLFNSRHFIQPLSHFRNMRLKPVIFCGNFPCDWTIGVSVSCKCLQSLLNSVF